MKNIIVEKYQNFKGELKVTLKVQPETLEPHVVLTLDSDCDEKVVGGSQVSEVAGGSQEITCKGVTVEDYEDFSLKIKLNPEICDLSLRSHERSFRIVASVFGQTDTSFEISVGKILSPEWYFVLLCGLYKVFPSLRPRVSV